MIGMLRYKTGYNNITIEQMSETTQPYNVNIKEYLDLRVNAEVMSLCEGLIRALKPGNLALLARLLGEVIDETGFGAVEIIIANGSIQNIKVIKSHRGSS